MKELDLRILAGAAEEMEASVRCAVMLSDAEGKEAEQLARASATAAEEIRALRERCALPSVHVWWHVYTVGYHVFTYIIYVYVYI